MNLKLRCTRASVEPSDASGFLVDIEVADAEEARGQLLRGPDDEADDWPLVKSYGENCERLLTALDELERVRGLLRRAIPSLHEECRMPRGWNRGSGPVSEEEATAALRGEEKP